MRVLRDAGVAGMAGMINQPRSALRLALWTSHWGDEACVGRLSCLATSLSASDRSPIAAIWFDLDSTPSGALVLAPVIGLAASLPATGRGCSHVNTAGAVRRWMLDAAWFASSSVLYCFVTFATVFLCGSVLAACCQCITVL